MKNKLFFLILVAVVLLYFLSTGSNLTSYDLKEYLTIVAGNPFLRSLSLGHNPIHPGFIGFLWTATQITKLVSPDIFKTANYIGLFCGLVSVFLVYKTARIFFEQKKAILTTILFSLFPSVYVINTNLFIESFLLVLYILTIYLASLYLIKQQKVYLVGLFIIISLMLFSHIQAIFWIPSVFVIIPIFFREKYKRVKKSVTQLIIVTLSAIGFGFISYGLVYLISKRNISSDLNGIFVFYPNYIFGKDITNLLRMVRNVFISSIRGFGTLIPFLVFILLIKDYKHNKKGIVIILALLAFSLFFPGAVWAGDFMLRRIVFVAPLFALLISFYIPKFTWLIIVYLLPIFLFNFRLYSKPAETQPLGEIYLMQKNLPKNNILIQTHYLRPFTYDYKGKILWISESDFSGLGSLMKTNNIYLDSQAVFAPYLLYVGNNLHITSLGMGDSDAKSLFKDHLFDLAYVYDSDKRIFSYKISDMSQSFTQRIEMSKKFINEENIVVIGKTNPQTPIYIYSKSFWQRIHRERIDYGDVFTWLYIIVSGKKEPVTFSYADRDGIFITPLSRNLLGNFYIEGSNISEVKILE